METNLKILVSKIEEIKSVIKQRSDLINDLMAKKKLIKQDIKLHTEHMLSEKGALAAFEQSHKLLSGEIKLAQNDPIEGEIA